MSRKLTFAGGERRTDLDSALRTCLSASLAVGALSTALNMLMLASPIYMLQIYDRVLTTGHTETLVFLTAMALFALMLLGALDALRSIMLARVGVWLTRRTSAPILWSGVRMRLLGDLAGTQPLRDLSTVQSFVSSPGCALIFDAPWIPVFCTLIWLLHPALGMLSVIAAVMLAACALANEILTRRSAQIASVSQIAANQAADSIMRNAEAVRAMGMFRGLEARWREMNERALSAQEKVVERSGALLGVTKFLRFGVQVGILALGAWLVLHNELTGGGMIAASILLGRALAPVEQGIGAWRSFANARLALTRLRARAHAIPPEQPRIRLPAPLGIVTMTDVSYTAPGGREPVLRNVTLSINPGEAVAVIGPSASGKSTLCRLLVGVVHPTSGSIRLDGSDLRHWDSDQLGAAIGYLPQDVELFAGTVSENISRMSAAPDEDAVVAAAITAHAHALIQHLPQGYQTQIGEGGSRLSGGQRQRIGLARAVYGQPPLIVLDEPNSNLDQIGESALAAAVKELKSRGAALVIVGHRPSTIAEADKVLLLKDGRVEFFGPREQVLQQLRGKAQTEASREPPPRPTWLAQNAARDVAAAADAHESAADSRLPRAADPFPAHEVNP